MSAVERAGIGRPPARRVRALLRPLGLTLRLV
jgi:hypothetical protein